MDKVDTKTLIHVGTELVVIGGLTFWLNRRISSIQSQVALRDKKIEELEALVQQQSQVLAEHEEILRYIMTGKPPPQRHPPAQEGMKDTNEGIRVPQGGSKPMSAPPRDMAPPPPPDPMVSQTELDDIIRSELAELEQQRTTLEIDVTEGTESLKPEKQSPKVAKKSAE